MTKTGQPIIDQHVLRAFRIYQTKDLKEVARWRKKDTLNKTDRSLIDDYKDWLKSDEITKDLRNQQDYSYHIDQLLFALGKTIKLVKSQRSNN